jgi:hypothetical protein
MGNVKNKSSEREKFLASKNGQQRTTIHHETTTNSPSKNHVLHVIFRKTPSKNHKNSLPKNSVDLRRKSPRD